MADFEFFKKQFEFVGKHARMVSELCVSNDYEHTYFKRYIDVYIFAAIIGIMTMTRKEAEHILHEPATDKRGK